MKSQEKPILTEANRQKRSSKHRRWLR
jgi:hypothetical protein